MGFGSTQVLPRSVFLATRSRRWAKSEAALHLRAQVSEAI